MAILKSDYEGQPIKGECTDKRGVRRIHTYKVYLPSIYAGLLDLAKDIRGILFGTALALLALSNGSRVSELLQVSWNKERAALAD